MDKKATEKVADNINYRHRMAQYAGIYLSIYQAIYCTSSYLSTEKVADNINYRLRMAQYAGIYLSIYQAIY